MGLGTCKARHIPAWGAPRHPGLGATAPRTLDGAGHGWLGEKQEPPTPWQTGGFTGVTMLSQAWSPPSQAAPGAQGPLPQPPAPQQVCAQVHSGQDAQSRPGSRRKNGLWCLRDFLMLK